MPAMAIVALRLPGGFMSPSSEGGRKWMAERRQGNGHLAAEERTRVDVPAAEGRQVGDQQRRRSARREPEVGEDIGAETLGHAIVGHERTEGREARGEYLGVQVGVVRQILQHRRHQHPVGLGRRPDLLIEVEGLADHVLAAEVLARHAPGQDHAVGPVEGALLIARKGRQRQDLEHLRIGPIDLLHRLDLAVPHHVLDRRHPRDA
jgi:hypothetical protein